MVRDWFRKLSPTRIRQQKQPETPVVSVPFADVESTLALYVKALSRDRLKVMSSSLARQGAYSDGRTVFVPPEIEMFDDPTQARLFYRVASAWKVMQVASGTLDLERVPDPTEDRDRFLYYEVLTGEWVDRTLVEVWPGLARNITLMRQDALERRSHNGKNGHSNLEPLIQSLLRLPLNRQPGSEELQKIASEHPQRNGELRDMLVATRDMLHADEPGQCLTLATEFSSGTGNLDDTVPDAVHFRGRIRPDLLKPPEIHIEDIKADPKTGSSRNRRPPPRNEPMQIESNQPLPRQNRNRKSPTGGRQSLQISLADREPARTFHSVPLTEEEKKGAYVYHEWDYLRQMYLPEWCALRTRRPKSGSTDKVEQILRQHSALIRHLKQQFEALRPERLRMTRQLDGDEIDLGAYVDSRADQMAGLSPSDKLYSHVQEKERNIALACLIDLSGSTGAWIDDDPRNDQVIEVTRRGIVFLCEALTVLDDRHAVYGFSGSTRKHAEFSIVKEFDESYGETVKGRINGLSPSAYTRMGPAIRHAVHNLTMQPARVRILMLLSDGRPNDFDGYGGRYGIEDTRKALIEARQSGVSTFALTIDGEARDYMPYTFGIGHYMVIEDTPALATKLSDVYRRLTVQ
ncbi:MAG: VWA domain-containing protein [Sphaerobacteraceae bacterium]|nr:MAG: VWA domain-containing protein [Sphaerobacteraceae bacterium]